MRFALSALRQVFSGASVLWFINPVSWAFMFPLYLAHLLLFFNLAILFRRTSLSSLYLWGVLFGMYESWITKVTWAGYMGQEPQWGTVLGFAPAEFLIIIFIWHPVMSFIVPLFLFETLSTSQDREQSCHGRPCSDPAEGQDEHCRTRTPRTDRRGFSFHEREVRYRVSTGHASRDSGNYRNSPVLHHAVER